MILNRYCEYPGCNRRIKSSIGLCKPHRPVKVCIENGCDIVLGDNNKSGYCRGHLPSRKTNPESNRRASLKWIRNNRERHNESAKRWQRNNPGKRRAITQNYQARKEEAFVEDIDLQIVWERDGGICCICGDPVDLNNWWIEHKTPLSRGGLHCYDNVGVSHPECNRSKLSKTMEEYKEWLFIP